MQKKLRLSLPGQVFGAIRKGARIALMIGLLFISVTLTARPAQAADSYQIGYISRVSYTGDHLIIMLDSGVPTNCAGTTYSWMMVPAANKPMLAFVTGLWMRGDAATKQVVVYTTPTDSSGFCQINQIDTQSAG
jgi:hypothetical protein